MRHREQATLTGTRCVAYIFEASRSWSPCTLDGWVKPLGGRQAKRTRVNVGFVTWSKVSLTATELTGHFSWPRRTIACARQEGNIICSQHDRVVSLLRAVAEKKHGLAEVKPASLQVGRGKPVAKSTQPRNKKPSGGAPRSDVTDI